jgi:glycerol kinase
MAIDQGTTSTRAILFDSNALPVCVAQRELEQHYPALGWVEHDPEQIWRDTLSVAREALGSEDPGHVAAIGITNQRETIVIWERASGRPVHRALVWQDRRTAQRCQELAPRTAWIAERTGLLPDPYFSATKIEWLIRENRLLERYRANELAVGTIDSWLVWQLTGGVVHATDPTNASRTMLFDIDRLAWSPELCELFGVPMEMLPDVRPSSGDFGVSTTAILGAEIPILGIAGDQQAALFGQGCVTRGTGKNTYGTGAFLLLNTGTERPAARDGLLTTIACDARGGAAYALEAAIFIAGAAVQWLRDGLGFVASAGEIEALAGSVPDSGGVIVVPAFTGLGAPHWRPDARGAITGLTRGTTRAHIARATLEGIALQNVDILRAMERDAGRPLTVLKVDGGASANDLLMQFQSDVLGVQISRPELVETTALGAAFLAGLGTGVWKDQDQVKQTWREHKRFQPTADRARVAEHLARWDVAVARA